MTAARHELRLPELGLDERTNAVCSLWLVSLRAEVSEGDRLLEVLAGAATIDLPAPASGILIAQLVDEGQVLSAGQILGIIEENS